MMYCDDIRLGLCMEFQNMTWIADCYASSTLLTFLILIKFEVSWYFEPSQPQRITSRQKTMFNLSAIYSAHKSSNHKLSKNHIISPDTNLLTTKHTQRLKKKKNQRISPFGIAPVEKAHKATCWYWGPFCRFVNTRIKKKKLSKRNGQKQKTNNKKTKKILMHNSKYQCQMAACCAYHQPT